MSSSLISYPTNSDDIINVIIHEIVKRAHGVMRIRLFQSRTPAAGVVNTKGAEDQLKMEIEQDYSEVLAAFIVRASIVDPRNNFDVEKDFSRQDVERLIQICVDYLTASNSPSLETIRMQIAFDTSLPIQADHLRKDKASKAAVLAPLLREILECQSKKLTTVEELYRKVVTYVIIKSELGDPLDINVVKEATAALESTFPNSEVNVFISLPRKEKESQLVGLTQLVTGIRLFNQELGKGGDGIPKVPKLCEDELIWAKNQIAEMTAKISDDIDLYTAIIKVLIEKKSPESSKEEKEILVRLKEGLTFSYQFLTYLKTLDENRLSSDKVLQSNMARFKDCLRELKGTCKSKTAVPVDHVYPQFMLLSTCWNNLKDELFFLEFRRNLLTRLIKYSKNFNITIPEGGRELVKNYKGSTIYQKLSDVEIIGKSADLMSTVGLYTKKIEVLHPGNSSMYDRLKSEFSGFCPYQLVMNESFLLPGDRNLGLLRYKDQLFSFSTFESAVEFSKDPEAIIQKIIDNACIYPQLVHLLFLHKYFPTFAALEGVRSFSKQKLLGKVTVTYDAVTQTDTHIVDTYIDKNYEWNEWALRRKALMLVNLRHKVTHSTQTNKSHFRREMETQHFEKKDTNTQTVVDSSTNVPKKVNFLKGLRHANGKPTELKVVDLTLDL